MKTSLLAILGIVIAFPALAWDACGHKTVATIAGDQLTPAARAKIDALFAADPRGRKLVDSATWPDDIKQNERNDPPKALLTKPWHYVNVPYDATSAQMDTILEKPGTVVDPTKSGSANVVTAIRYYTAYLKSGVGTPIQKADALSWLVHLVGDVHQPLHTLTVNKPLPNYTPIIDADGESLDQGGNGFALSGTSESNLHSYWDNRLVPGHKPGWNSDARARAYATALSPKHVPGMFAMFKTDPKSWAIESYNERAFVYSPPLAPTQPPAGPRKHLIPPAYATKSRTIAEKRIVLAGYRLGKLLNGIYGG